MKKVLAIILSVTMILGCAVLCTSAKFGDTVTESDAVVEISDYGTTTVLLAKQTTAVDDSDDTIEHGVPLVVGADPNGYPYFDNVRAGDYYTFTANVNTAGTYSMALNFGWNSRELVGDFSVYVDGVKEASLINEVMGLNWQEWTLTTETTVELPEGEHEIKIVVDCYAINLSALCIAPMGTTIEPEYPNLLSKSPVIEEEDPELFPVDVTYGTVAYRFIANAPFDAFAFMLGTSGTDSKCEISLFAYDTNYEKTLENEPIVTHMQEPLADNSLIEVSTGEVLPAGEYLAYLDATMLDEDEQVSVYAYILLESYPTGFIYVDGELWEDVVPTIIVNFTQELDSGIYFGQCEVGEDLPGDDFGDDFGDEVTEEDQGGDDTATPGVDDTAAPDVDGTAAPEVDGTAAPEVDGTVAAGTAAGTDAATAAGTAAGTNAPATTTAAAAAEGCKAVVGSMSAIALVAVASAAAVVLKKKED